MNRVIVRFTHSPAARKALIEKIVRVDHAGELGADRIYAGQMAVLGGTSFSPKYSFHRILRWFNNKENVGRREGAP